MKLRATARKVVKWGGAIVGALFVAVWAASGWWRVEWLRPSPSWDKYTVEQGMLTIFLPSSSEAKKTSLDFAPGIRLEERRKPALVWVREPRFKWWFSYGTSWGNVRIQVPLWMFAAVALILTAPAWMVDGVARRRTRAGRCGKCGYDLHGTDAGNACPECGAAKSASTSRAV